VRCSRGLANVNELSKLLSLPEPERMRRGLAHTSKEIAQQPETWLSTFQLFRTKRAEIAEFLSSAGVSGTAGCDLTVFLVGAGTSDYIGHSLTHLLRKLWHCEVIAIPSTDLLTHMDELLVPGRKYLWISFSRSGESPEGVAVLNRACNHRPDIHHVVISCNENGRMVVENTHKPQLLTICLSDTVNDRGLAMTSSFSNMVIVGHCLAHYGDLDGYEPTLLKLVSAARDFLPRAADCAAGLAKEEYAKACFIASGPLRAVAKESALKLLELTAGETLTMSESALGLRHGPMAALDHDTLLVCFLSGSKSVQAYERDLLREVGSKQLAGSRMVVAGEEQDRNSYAEHYLAADLGTVADEYRTPVDVIFGQLLGLFSSIQWGLMPDCPSPSGAISRVVQNVSIHC
jgi:tagatose-6-phosphate ketose/aldose isomerase